MKKIIPILAIISLPFLSFAQNGAVSELQEKYQGKADCFSLTVSGDLLGKLCRLGDTDADPDLKDLVQGIQSLRILSVNKRTEGYSARDLKRLRAEIKDRNLEEVLSIKSEKSDIKLMIRDRNGKIKEAVMIIDEPNEGFTTLDFSGNLEGFLNRNE